jgi:segregation and condensation protein B
MTRFEHAVRLAEALIFASAEPVGPAALARALPDDLDVDVVLDALRARYVGRGVQLEAVAGGWQFRTAPDLAPLLTRVVQQKRRLPRAAMETLAVIAYHQPVTRTEIETIRGAALGQNVMDTLLESGLIEPRGRKEVPGRPTLWATTPAFLTQFGLHDLRDLPRREELLGEGAGASEPAGAPPPSPSERGLG